MNYTKPSRIICQNIYAEDIFRWLYSAVISSSGDGWGALVCENYFEAADLFISMHSKELEGYVIKETANSKSIDRDQEGFTFTNHETKLFSGDYIFIVAKDCSFGWTSDKRLKSVEICEERIK